MGVIELFPCFLSIEMNMYYQKFMANRVLAYISVTVRVAYNELNFHNACGGHVLKNVIVRLTSREVQWQHETLFLRAG
ncbi:hypothetical protein GQ457_14G018540 [Hibiscus cannabinus]